MKKNNLILLIKNQISDNPKNENTLHLNTLLLSSIENPSYEKINEYFQSTGKNQINVRYYKD